jgi:hypothetical protein
MHRIFFNMLKFSTKKDVPFVPKSLLFQEWGVALLRRDDSDSNLL